MSRVFVVAAKRSAIGSFLGGLSTLHPSVYGSQVLKAALEQAKVDVAGIEEVIVGNILPAGLGQGIGRQVSVKAGVPVEVPGLSLNMLCGSGMKAVMDSYAKIKAGFGSVYAAGGVEAMSFAPFLVDARNRSGARMGDQKLVDHMINDALTDAFNNYHMGVTAENIVAKHGFSREEQDAFAYESQVKAAAADDAGRFADEIVPIVYSTRRGEVTFDKDEYINRKTTPEILAKLRPAFIKDGSVTAGNSSGINDGASFLVLASEEAVKEQGLTPLAEIIAIGQGGVDPAVMGLGPVPAVRQALKSANLNLSDIDVLELNEAFAAQSLGVVTELAEEHDLTKEEILARTNPNGGAIALGHPVGASGNRIIVTLIHEMLRRDDVEYGLASLCIGGGMGSAVILKKVK